MLPPWEDWQECVRQTFERTADRGSWYRPARIDLVDYDERWRQMYAEAVAQIVPALSDDLVAIEHVGSTAVPGMPTKPIIDILAAVATWDHFDDILRRLHDLDTPESEDDDSNRRVFRKGPADLSHLRTHHLHMTETGSGYWKRIIAFRDQLSVDPADAAAYAELKRQLAMTFEHDSRSYTSGKDEFVKAGERKRGALG